MLNSVPMSLYAKMIEREDLQARVFLGCERGYNMLMCKDDWDRRPSSKSVSGMRESDMVGFFATSTMDAQHHCCRQRGPG